MMDQKTRTKLDGWRRRWMMGVASLVTTLCTQLWVLVLVGTPGRRGAALFKWHPILMSFATMILIPCGLSSWMLWRDSVGLREDIQAVGRVSSKRRIFFKALHVICVVWAFVMMSIGIAMAYVSHVQQGFANLYSFHSWVGALTIVMIQVNIIGGICGSCWRKAYSIMGGGVHRMIGIMTLALGFASVTLGFAEYQTFIVRDKGPWSAAAVFASILALATCVIGTCYVIDLGTATSEAYTNARSLVPTAGKAEVHAHDDAYGVPVISNIDTDTREISSGSGASS